ncbi:MAG TPA: hypothetical protein VLJ16_14365 [Acidobacteriota bacterium]|nr:hypothetical protein [Acidobacteriota bacterium]
MFGKRFLIGICALAFIAFGISGCSSSTTPGGGGGTTHMFTSTSVNAHTHTVTIDRADVTTPPAAGITESTSSSAGHSHSFAMTQAQLTTVNGGTAVNITTGSSSVTGAHTHDISISKWF